MLLPIWSSKRRINIIILKYGYLHGLLNCNADYGTIDMILKLEHDIKITMCWNGPTEELWLSDKM